MAEINFDLKINADGIITSLQGVNGAMDEIQQSTDNISTSTQKAFNSKEVKIYEGELHKAAKATTEVTKETNKLANTGNRLKELKKELKALQAEALAAGEGTDKFRDSLTKAGAIKDQINDLNAALSGLAGNVGENLANASGKSIGLIITGFEGATAASALFGENAKAVEETLVKLQALNALSKVAQELGGLGDKLNEIKLGFAPLVDGITSGGDSIKTKYKGVNDSLVSFFGNFKENAKGLVKNSVEGIKNLASNFGGFFRNLGSNTVSFFQNFGSNFKSFGSTAKSSFQSLGAVIKANPLFLIISVITIVVGLLVAMKDKIKPIAVLFKALGDIISWIGDKLEELGEFLGLTASAAEKANQRTIDSYDEVSKAITSRYDRELKLAKAQGKDTEEIEKAKFKEQVGTINKTIQALLAKKVYEGKLGDEEVKKLKELSEEKLNIYNDEQVRVIENANAKAKAEEEKRKEALEKAKEAAAKRKQLEKELADFLISIAKRLQAAELETLNPVEKIKKQQEIAQAEINELEKQLLLKAQALKKGAKLTAEQEEQFAKLRLLINQKAAEDLFNIELQNQNALADLRKQDADLQLSALEQQEKLALAKAQGVKNEAGLEEVEFEKLKQQKLLEVQRSFLEAKLQLELNQLKATTEARETALENELKKIEDETDEASQIKRKGLEQELTALQQGYQTQSDLLKQNNANSIATIDKQLDEIKKKAENKGIDLAKLLGLSEEQFKGLEKAINQSVEGIQQAAQAFFDFQNAKLENEQAQSDANKERLDNDLSDLENRLQIEQDLADRGLANNLDRVKAEIAAKQAAQKEELERSKKIAEEKKKLAREQLVIDTALQASQLILSIANLFAEGSKFWIGAVPVGLIAAGIAAAGMTASFIAGKAKAFDAVNSNAPSFKEGGYYEGYTGSYGVDDAQMVELHGQEYVMNNRLTRSNRDLFDGLHFNDKQKIRLGIENLLDNTGVVLSDKYVSKLSEHKLAVMNGNKQNITLNLDSMTNRLDTIEKHLAEINVRGKKDVKVLGEGVTMENRGDVKRIVRK